VVLTGDAFLQELIEATHADLLQQVWVKLLKGLHPLQPSQDYIHIFSRAFCWPKKHTDK